MGKKGFTTVDGLYYEASERINPDDSAVALRTTADGAKPNMGTPSVDDRQQQLDFQPCTQAQLTAQSFEQKKFGENVLKLDENTQFKFKVKDIIIIVAFIVSIAISWNNSDTRATRTEEQVKQLRIDLDTQTKKREDAAQRQEDLDRATTAQINDVMRSILLDRDSKHGK